MSDSSSVGQRFSQLIQALGMSKNAFAISLDKTATVIQHLVDERNKPGFNLMNKVVDVYPNVSIEWLLRGRGPMMLSSAPTSNAPAATDSLPAAAPVAPVVPKVAPVPITPIFPAPLFAVSAAGPTAPQVPPVASAAPTAAVQDAPPAVPETVVQPAPVPAPSAPSPVTACTPQPTCRRYASSAGRGT